MGFYTTIKNLVISGLHKQSSDNIRLEALILNCTKTGKQSSSGEEIKLLLHISPSHGRSYLQEHIDVYPTDEIRHYLQPGQIVSLKMNSIKGKAILSWKES